MPSVIAAVPVGGMGMGGGTGFGGHPGAAVRNLQYPGVPAGSNVPYVAADDVHFRDGCFGPCSGPVVECADSTCNAGLRQPNVGFVGAGQGEYAQETTYRYVGQGGDYTSAPEVDLGCLRLPLRSALLGGGTFIVLLLLAALAVWAVASKTALTQSSASSAMRGSAPSACSGNAATWSAELYAHCCGERLVGCTTTRPPSRDPSEPVSDCDMGLESTRETWSKSKQEWCCQNEGKGCDSLEVGTCQIWGDPHFETFDGAKVDFLGEGQAYLVKSGGINVQASFMSTPYTNGLAATHEVAVGGLLMGQHILRVGPVDGRILWDGMPILESYGDFDADGLGRISYSSVGEVIDQLRRSMTKNVVHVELPHDFRMQILRWENHINARIVMRRVPGIDGYCGNFNGDAEDDEHVGRTSGDVLSGELYFDTLMPRTPGKQLTLADCPAEKLEEARRSCASLEAEHIKFEGCQFDACFVGDRYAVQDVARGW